MTALLRIAQRRAELYARPMAIVRWGLPIALLGGLTAALWSDLHPAAPPRIAQIDHRAHHVRRLGGHPSRLDRTFTKMSRAMFVSFPRWLGDHPQQWCPASIRDLLRASPPPWSGETLSNLDAWHHPMELRCADTPAGHAIQLRSPGPDGQFDTPDDLFVAR